jgi:hypothetical protein
MSNFIRIAAEDFGEINYLPSENMTPSFVLQVKRPQDGRLLIH